MTKDHSVELIEESFFKPLKCQLCGKIITALSSIEFGCPDPDCRPLTLTSDDQR